MKSFRAAGLGLVPEGPVGLSKEFGFHHEGNEKRIKAIKGFKQESGTMRCLL